MPYFTAVLVREGPKWTARDVDVESMSDRTEAVDTMREIGSEENPVLLLVEREDAWWGVVRVDGDEDPRVFVSSASGAGASVYAEVLAVDVDDTDELVETDGCVGDLDLLADLGTPPEVLQQMCDDEVLPMDALTAVAEAAGFAEVLDSLR